MRIEDHRRINALIGAQRWDAALQEIDRVLATAPDDGHALACRSLALLNLGRFADALTAADRAIAARPAAVWPQLLRTDALRCLGRRRDALASAERVAAIAPNDQQVRLMLARCQLFARRRKDAEQTAAGVVADDPTSVAAWIVVGDTRLGRNNPAAADAYKRALAIDPTSASAANGLGSAYQRMGKRREAAGMYTQAARLAPHSTIPRRNLEQLAAGLGGLGIVVVVTARVLSSSSILTGLGVLAILTVISVPIFLLLRRRRLAALPPEARAFVESRRRARWRTLRDPRNWPELIRANPLVALLGLVAVGVLAVLFLTRPESLRRDPFEDFDPDDLQLPTLTPQTTTLGIVLRCADGSTVPLGPGADIAGCEDYTVGVDLPGDPAPSSSVEPDG